MAVERNDNHPDNETLARVTQPLSSLPTDISVTDIAGMLTNAETSAHHLTARRLVTQREVIVGDRSFQMDILPSTDEEKPELITALDQLNRLHLYVPPLDDPKQRPFIDNIPTYFQYLVFDTLTGKARENMIKHIRARYGEGVRMPEKSRIAVAKIPSAQIMAFWGLYENFDPLNRFPGRQAAYLTIYAPHPGNTDAFAKSLFNLDTITDLEAREQMVDEGGKEIRKAMITTFFEDSLGYLTAKGIQYVSFHTHDHHKPVIRKAMGDERVKDDKGFGFKPVPFEPQDLGHDYKGRPVYDVYFEKDLTRE